MRKNFLRLGTFLLPLIVFTLFGGIYIQTTLAGEPAKNPPVGPIIGDWSPSPSGNFLNLKAGLAYQDDSILVVWDEETIIYWMGEMCKKGIKSSTSEILRLDPIQARILSLINIKCQGISKSAKKAPTKADAYSFFSDMFKFLGGFAGSQSYTLSLPGSPLYLKNTVSGKGKAGDRLCGYAIVEIIVSPKLMTGTDLEAGLARVDVILDAISTILAKSKINTSKAEPAGVGWPQPNGSQFPASDNWGYEKVFFPPSASGIPITASISKVRVAVLDTGIDENWFGAKATPPSDSWNKTSIDPFTKLTTTHIGHGTGVAGIISGSPGTPPGKNVGVTWSSSGAAQILDMPVCSEGGNPCPATKIIQSICAAAASPRADIINLSLGGVVSSTIMKGAIRDAINAGVLVVAAAGNSNNISTLGINPNDPVYPAASEPDPSLPGFASKSNDGFISVGSTKLDVSNPALNDYFKTATSNPYVSLSAPGDQVLTYDNLGKVQSFTGTSYAAAYVSGAAAIAISRYIDLYKTTANPTPKPKPAKLEEWLVNGASSQKITSCPATDECGAGVLNIPNTYGFVK
jgi:Subtilase family